jgi:hypothetical protein
VFPNVHDVLLECSFTCEIRIALGLVTILET